MIRHTASGRNIRISCSLCDFMTEAEWIDQAVRDLREHTEAVHGMGLTDQEAAAVLRGELEKNQAA